MRRLIARSLQITPYDEVIMLGKWYRTSSNSASPHIITPWAYALLAVIAFGIGIEAANVNIQFFVMGLEETETNKNAIGLLTQLGITLAITELFCFFVPPLLHSDTWKKNLKNFGYFLIVFEVVVISITQVVLAEKAETVVQAQESRIESLRASIRNRNRIVEANTATAEASGKSKYLVSRREATATLQSALDTQKTTEAPSLELENRLNSLKPSIQRLLGKTGTVIFSIVRALCICLAGIIMFSCAGYLIKNWLTASADEAGDGDTPPEGRKRRSEPLEAETAAVSSVDSPASSPSPVFASSEKPASTSPEAPISKVSLTKRQDTSLGAAQAILSQDTRRGLSGVPTKEGAATSPKRPKNLIRIYGEKESWETERRPAKVSKTKKLQRKAKQSGSYEDVREVVVKNHRLKWSKNAIKTRCAIGWDKASPYYERLVGEGILSADGLVNAEYKAG